VPFGSVVNLYVFLIDYKIGEGSVLHSKNLVANFHELRLELVRASIRVIALFLVLHEHGGNSHIEDEEPTDPNARDEVRPNECGTEDVLVHQHDVGPAVLGRANEDRQKCTYHIVELGDAEV
jgi:hypothetical protein